MARALNQNLKRLHDGALASSIDLAHWDRVHHEVGRVHVFWPFVTFQQVDGLWNVTHAPTGYRVATQRTRKKAVALIHQLRAAADFNFTAPEGRKAKAAKKATVAYIPPLVPVA